MTDRVEVTIADHVAHVRMVRADKRNGLDLPMFDALVDAGRRVRDDGNVRAVVLSGAGPAFCAGLDWQAFMVADAAARAKLLLRDDDSPANLAQRACWIWAELPIPVVAAVQGAAYGGGLQLALAADVRLLAADAKLSAMEIRYGIIPDMTASQTLLRLVRPDLACELIYTGRVVEAEEAVRIGLGTRVCADPLADALALARTIAASSPDAIRAAKQLCQRAPSMSTADALHFETTLQLSLLGTPNQLEAVAATLQKRAATFE
ncbi:MAG: crotonase/enoyl-CoA hydratase family protein [Nannocystaceae bacterium]|nr:crotonase/enoyl-CoA hydratase family protein [Nannocystaceae bacterium]